MMTGFQVYSIIIRPEGLRFRKLGKPYSVKPGTVARQRERALFHARRLQHKYPKKNISVSEVMR